ncbi:class B sortase [Lacrimispora algidixylanolytica]
MRRTISIFHSMNQKHIKRSRKPLPPSLHFVKSINLFKVCMFTLWLTMFLVFAMKLILRVNTYKDARKEYTNLEKSIWNNQSNMLSPKVNTKTTEESLKEINPDYLLWISIPGTSVNYPVVKSRYPGYYLSHTFFCTENPSGSLFIQEDATQLGDGNLVIFGHNMKDGTMFADLKQYKSQEFYKDHRNVHIYNKGRWYQAEIYSVQITDENDLNSYETGFGSQKEKENFILNMKEKSIYSTSCMPPPIDTLITLSTCHGSAERMIVQAALICYTEN